MLIAVAVIGWLLFLFIAFIYRVGIQEQIKESHAIALYSLTILLSDEARNISLELFETTLAKYEGSLPIGDATYAMMDGLAKGAKDAAGVNLNFVLNEIQKRTKHAAQN